VIVVSGETGLLAVKLEVDVAVGDPSESEEVLSLYGWPDGLKG
jgi:hypothetical protein